MTRTPHSPSRRTFLNSAAGTSAAMLLAPAWFSSIADPTDTRIAQVMARTIAIDMHNHVYPTGTEPHMQHGPAPANEPPQPPSLPLAQEIRRSGLTAVCASFVLDFAQNNKPGDAISNYLNWLTAMDRSLDAGHLRRALNLSDLQSAHDHAQPTIVQSIEGAQFIEGKLDRISEVYKRGVRHLQLLHMRDDLVSPLGDVNTVAAHMGGLTSFGADVIRACNREGILVDLAHASHETVLGALKVTKQPFIVSHTSLESWKGGNPKVWEMMKPHLITAEHAKVVADAGGVVGVWTKLADSLQDFVRSIKAMVDAIGIDHVGIGTDTDLLSTHPGQGTNLAYANLTSGFFPAVVAEMLHQGFTPDEISKIGGGNFCRVFAKATSTRN